MAGHAPPPPEGLYGWAALALYVIGHICHLIVKHTRQGLRQADMRDIERRLDDLIKVNCNLAERVSKIEGRLDPRK